MDTLYSVNGYQFIPALKGTKEPTWWLEIELKKVVKTS